MGTTPSQSRTTHLHSHGIVALKGGRNGRWCGAGGHGTMACTRNSIGGNEKFMTVPIHGRWGFKQNTGHGPYCADERHHNRIICNRPWLGQWERYYVHSHGHQWASKEANTTITNTIALMRT